MSISKRVRFEVLRRDSNTCQYCGSTAPDVKITVDHVMPTALGGSDFPDNLVAACADCNSGKASIAPDSPLVEKVKGAAADFAAQGTKAAAKIRAEYEASAPYLRDFKAHWDAWGDKRHALPVDWRSSVTQWWRVGVPIDLLREAIDLAMRKKDLRSRFAYTAGVVWTRLDSAGVGDVADSSVGLYTAEEIEDLEFHNYRIGWDGGAARTADIAFAYMHAHDAVALHIDRRGEPLPMEVR